MVQLLLGIIYLSFISLGLPDSLLGAAWPSMHPDLQVPISYAGIVSMIIALGTVISSLQSDRMTKKLGTGKVTIISVVMTAAALFGFSVSSSFWGLCLWAIPYGLGAGSVDASLNNYVAIHYASRHMSWLHCMWGVGASIGPYIMGLALSGGSTWNTGYWYVALIQLVLVFILLLSLPLWKQNQSEGALKAAPSQKVLKLTDIIRIPGSKQIMVMFFCYCAMEQTIGLWASSFLIVKTGISEAEAAKYAGLLFLGITIGRGISGFLTMKLNDTKMIYLGQFMMLAGVLAITLPELKTIVLAGLFLIGVGGAPIFPCLLHATPEYFGKDRSQAIIGVQMASAYVGTSLMPPLFGVIANCTSVIMLPIYVLTLWVIMAVMYEGLKGNSAV